jgi:hypothetical protein
MGEIGGMSGSAAQINTEFFTSIDWQSGPGLWETARRVEYFDYDSANYRYQNHCAGRTL